MKLWRLKHKATGLYYGPKHITWNQGFFTNLSARGRIYHSQYWPGWHAPYWSHLDQHEMKGYPVRRSLLMIDEEWKHEELEAHVKRGDGMKRPIYIEEIGPNNFNIFDAENNEIDNDELCDAVNNAANAAAIPLSLPADLIRLAEELKKITEKGE